MKRRARWLFGLAAIASLLVLFLKQARAADGGAGPEITPCKSDTECASAPATPHCCIGSSCEPVNVCVACVDYTGNPCAPVACDGALCDTTNGAECSALGGPGRRGKGAALPLAVLAALPLLLLRRRRRLA